MTSSYTTPGVYIEEITPAGPIASVGTSTTALIGRPSKALAAAAWGRPVLITNWSQYLLSFAEQDEKGQFQPYAPGRYLPHAVRGFFENGGSLAYVIPIPDLTPSEGDDDEAKALKAGALDKALDALTRLPDVALVCAPDVQAPALQKDILGHCERMQDRFAILDGVSLAQDTDAAGASPLDADGPLLRQRALLESANGFGGLYWPWIKISDPVNPATDQIAVPPSGHIAGIFARSDTVRGVHKAPANEVVRGAIDLDYLLNDREQGVLNGENVNALRVFPGRPPILWGARTLTREAPWQYVNVRRLFSFVEDSLVQGLRWAVFEPNSPTLWKQLDRTISEFLTRIWQAGALFGRTAKEAFYVKIDEELNPPATRALGQVVIEIGMAPVRPAEFVIVRIGMWDGGTRVNES